MKQRIESNFTEEELDSFLKKRYGYGIWEFEFNLAYIYGIYQERKKQKVYKFIEERIQRLENIKSKIIVTLDDFLNEIKFYELSNEFIFKSKIKWTPQNRTDFIIKHYKLNQFFSVINKQIDRLKGRKSYMENESPEIPTQILEPIYLKPLNLVILIWSYAMRRGSKIDWVNMQNLLNWFSKKLDEKGILDFFGFEIYNAPSTEILRLTRNKYRNTKYGIYAKLDFVLFFNVRKDEGKRRFPKPLDKTDDYKDYSLEYMKEHIDLMIIIVMRPLSLDTLLSY